VRALRLIEREPDIAELADQQREIVVQLRGTARDFDGVDVAAARYARDARPCAT